ncbi:putative F-box/FBD/LRR-repeat protein At5g62970 [Lotus japonicus]|uniref:putative F-box/FBD/LRR-repeat protein At5g62970 n=1 Tax=Lotus japonicus TaxID=34305 RepID=UPI00258FA014|nr:putative F-box/FBD/LRR-repeat protein At5g62970 [Lotus japonicus]
MKDILNTSVLSKRWSYIWYLMRDFKFDMLNVLGSEETLLEKGYIVDVTEKRYEFSDASRNEYVKIVDQIIKNFKGTEIDSFMVEFSMKQENSSTIDQWITFAVLRGVKRIDLLFGFDYDGYYKFPFGLFSKFDNSKLKHMQLRYCLVYQETSFEILPLTNLRSLILEDSKVDEIFLKTLLHDCHLLEELSLIRCDINTSILNIESSSLCLLKLEFCTLKGYNLHTDRLWINTPALKSIHFRAYCTIEETAKIFPLIATLPQLEILNLYIPNTPDFINYLNREDFTLENLKELNLIYGPREYNFDISWLSIILQASPILQKLSVMITSPMVSTHLPAIRDVRTFSHCEIKIIELGGCVGNFYEIEITLNALKYFHKLERIVLSPYWINEFLDQGLKCDPTWSQSGRERILEELHGKGIGLDKLVLV